MTAVRERPWNAILIEDDARRAEPLLAAVTADLEAQAPTTRDEALGRAWVGALAGSGEAVNRAGVREALRMATALPPGGPLADDVALACTRAWLEEAWGESLEMEDAPVAVPGMLRELPPTLGAEALARAVGCGRVVRARAAAHPEALAAYLTSLEGHDYPGPLMNAVQGLAGLLGVVVEGYGRLGWPLAPLKPLLDRVLRGARFALDGEGHLVLEEPWQGDPRFDPAAAAPQTRLQPSLGGHLGVWVLLARLQAAHPELLTPDQSAELARCLDLLSDFSYLIHKRLGFAATGMLEASLLVGAAGALQGFNQLYQLTGEEAHRLNARLWARRLLDLLDLAPPDRGRIRRGRVTAQGLTFGVDRGLAHGSAGVWLALTAALQGGPPPPWWSLVI